MLKYVVCAMLALSLTAGSVFAQDTTSGTQETSGTKHHKKGKKNKQGADAGAQAGKTVVNNKTCPVSGQDVNAMGHPYEVNYKGQTVKLCCESCKDKFMADADKNLEKAKADAAAHQ
jgi:YHS domain-containing protein